MKCWGNIVLGCLTLIVVWAVVAAVSSLAEAKDRLRLAEDRRDVSLLELDVALMELDEARVARIRNTLREAMEPRTFLIAVNLGEDLDDLQLCMEWAWAMCEDDGEIVCGIDVRGDCSFTCCPEEDVR